MSDGEGDSPMDVVQARQRKEKKELKEKCLAMKKAAKCGNKQKQKEANAAAEELEKEVEQRHAREMEQLTKQLSEAAVSAAPVTEEPKESREEGETSFYKESTINTKAKKKQAKQADMAQRLKAAIAEDREASLTSLRFIESTALIKVLQDRGLKLVDIAPDGDCLYNSVAHQLNRAGSNTQLKDVRRRAARYIMEHKDDFAPFLTNENGDPLDEFEFEKYCGTVESEAKDGGVWGGEPELIALSKSFERKIEVIQPEGRVIVYGEEYSTRPLTIVYQRHAYQLGEHYNSTEPATLA